MIAAFNDNRMAFEKVRDVLLAADGIERVEEGETELLPLPASQRTQIAALMRKAGVKLILVA